jgi:hypothetical protein
MNIKIRIFTLLLGFVFLSGCYKTWHQVDFKSLPAPIGLNAESYLPDLWNYHGSDEEFHYIIYNYNHNNLFFSKKFRIPKNEIKLIGINAVKRNRKCICSLSPICDSDGIIYAFYYTKKALSKGWYDQKPDRSEITGDVSISGTKNGNRKDSSSRVRIKRLKKPVPAKVS